MIYVISRADPKIFGFGKSRKSRTTPNISIWDFVRKDIFRSLFVRIWSIRSFGNSRIPNPERSDYTNLMRNYEACKGAKIGSIRPEPINWSPGGYRMADKINQTVSQSIHWFISPASLCNCIRHTACTVIIVYATEIYSCPATTAGIERVFSIAGHLIGLRATVMMDENFEQKLFCNVNKEVMLCGRKRKLAEIIK